VFWLRRSGREKLTKSIENNVVGRSVKRAQTLLDEIASSTERISEIVKAVKSLSGGQRRRVAISSKGAIGMSSVSAKIFAARTAKSAW
jgi:ABC-type lipoprotein export system ATPase subunit